MLILNPLPPSTHCLCYVSKHPVDLWEKALPFKRDSTSCVYPFASCWSGVDYSFLHVTGNILGGYLKKCRCSVDKKRIVRWWGRWRERERSLLMQRIHFVFPQTAAAFYNLIRFQDTTCLRTLQGTSPFPLSVFPCCEPWTRHVFLELQPSYMLRSKCLFHTSTCLFFTTGSLICGCREYWRQTQKHGKWSPAAVNWISAISMVWLSENYQYSQVLNV